MTGTSQPKEIGQPVIFAQLGHEIVTGFAGGKKLSSCDPVMLEVDDEMLRAKVEVMRAHLGCGLPVTTTLFGKTVEIRAVEAPRDVIL